MGDSYTASPGTGEDLHIGCARNVGSYVVQLEKDFPFTETNHANFIACSGYVATDVLQKTVPDIRQHSADFMVMSLGGNDIGFATIAIYCLITKYFFPFRSCEKVVQEAKNRLDDIQLENNIHSVYDRLFDKMKDDGHYQLYHIFYSRFFDATDSWCDSQTFRDDFIGKHFTGIKLTKRRRQLLNDLTDALNARLEEIAAKYIELKVGRASWAQGSRLITINPDEIPKADGNGTYALFDGHRFCESGAHDLESDNVWFFGTLDHDNTIAPPAGTGTTEKRKRNGLAGMEEIQRRGSVHAARAVNGSVDGIPSIFPFPPPPEVLIQSFHPKTKGMTAVKQLMQTVLQKHRPAESGGN